MGKYTDFSMGCIWISRAASEIERKAAQVLAEEIEKRTGIRLPIRHDPPGGSPYLYIGSNVPEELAEDVNALAAPGPEGCRILVKGSRAAAVGADSRGCMYGAGRLLRMMKWEENVLEFPESFAGTFTPRFSVRGHQLGYRQKTNAYDAWTMEMYEQYIRELVLFGANGIEILPPRTDDSGSRELMKYDPLEMMHFLLLAKSNPIRLQKATQSAQNGAPGLRS